MTPHIPATVELSTHDTTRIDDIRIQAVTHAGIGMQQTVSLLERLAASVRARRNVV